MENFLLVKLGKYSGIEDMPCGVCHTSLPLRNILGVLEYSSAADARSKCNFVIVLLMTSL